MKKEIALCAYLISVIYFVGKKIQPSIDIVVITTVICFGKVGLQTLLGFDQSEKRHIIWFKIFALLVITGLSVVGALLALETPSVYTDASSIKMFLYSIFFSVIGVDVYVLYSYFFEKDKEFLILD